MRCCHGPYLNLKKAFEYTLSKRSAFCRVCSRTQFVEQNKIPGRDFLHNRNNVGHMPGER